MKKAKKATKKKKTGQSSKARKKAGLRVTSKASSKTKVKKKASAAPKAQKTAKAKKAPAKKSAVSKKAKAKAKEEKEEAKVKPSAPRGLSLADQFKKQEKFFEKRKKAQKKERRSDDRVFSNRIGHGEERRKRPREKTHDDDHNLESDHTLDRTPMKIYLEQIEHIPLLTPDQEIELAEKIQSHHRGSAEARQRMIRSNLRLVISIAKRYSNMGLPFSDLVEEGNIGLMRAVEKFNPERGYRFSTYASWWIKQSIMRSLSNQGKTIRIPVYMYDIISKWRKVRDGLTQKLNRPPTRKEIAKYMNLPVNKIREIENVAGRPSSLNAPLSIDGSAELEDLIPDDESQNPEVRMNEMLKHQRIYQLIEKLDDREKRILILRFGLHNEEQHTLEEVAGEFGITRERVRQIEALALSKVRQMFIEEKENLSDYLNS